MRRWGEEPSGVFPDSDPLVSWKEIAAYLGVTPRTAQEWEKERGLPVHREGNPQRPTVVAYAAELDCWRQQSRLAPDGAASLRPAKTGVPKRLLVLLSVLVLLIGGFWATRPEPRMPAMCRVEGVLLKVFDGNGDLLWAVETPDLDTLWYQEGLHDTYHIADLDGDGRPEVLFNVTLKESTAGLGKLVCFDSAGRLRWEYRYGTVKRWQDRVFSDHYMGRMIRVLSDGDKTYVLLIATQKVWFPCQVSLLDAVTGELVSEYWHPGWLTSYNTLDLDGDGITEILLGGTNNAGLGCLGHAVLVALKIPFSRPQELTEEERARRFGGGEFRYCVFPAADVFRVRNQGTYASHIHTDSEEAITVSASNEVDGRLWYRLDKDFVPLSLVPCDGVIGIHGDLRREGLLDHDLTDEEIASWKKTYRYETAPHCHEDF
jgi:hypothetical protein